MKNNQDIISLPNTEKAKEIFNFLDVSEATREDYKFRINLFLDFLKENEINRNSFLEFKRDLAGRVDICTSTKNKYLATAKIFLKELNRQGVLPADITQNIKGFSQSKKHKVEGINDKEIKILFKAMRELKNTPENDRKRTLIVLLAIQGLRQIEITRLDVKDLNIANKTAFIQGKGQDDKEMIDLHPITIEAIKSYLKSNKIADGCLFVSNSNNSKNKRLTTRALRGIVKNFMHALGIEKTTHGFRHYFTTKLIESYDGNLIEVAKFTRHKTLEMLQVYNDNIDRKNSLPKFYKTFEVVNN